MVEPHTPPHIHRAYHNFCHAIHLTDNCPGTMGGCGPFIDLPSHLKHILRSLPGINALLATTSLSFPALADGTVIAGPNETFEMPSTKSEALMKRRGLSMAPAAPSRWPKATNRPRIAAVGRHDAMLFRSSATANSKWSATNVTQVHECGSDLVDSGFHRTVGRSGARVCSGQFRSARSYRSRRRLPCAEPRL